VTLVNSERESAGCGPLRVDPLHTAAAQEHSEDMDRRDYLSHESPEGKGPGDRVGRHGYDAWGAENIAKGQTSPEQMMDTWMGSQGNRDNILNCDLVAIWLRRLRTAPPGRLEVAPPTHSTMKVRGL
jgi:uncharacterized protein YkwD